MLFKSSFHFIIYSSVLLIIIHSKLVKRQTENYAPRCRTYDKPIDQVVDYQNPNENRTSRRKRFFLFPEFDLWRDDWRYLNQAKQIFYWVANFYPQKIDNEYIHRYIKEIIRQINTVLDEELTIELATDPGAANFHFNFFDYTKCPTEDTDATIENIQIFESLAIYSPELTKKSRYRAHGGIILDENDRVISTVKLNMQQTFIVSDDFPYDPIIYTCIEKENKCEIDLFWVILHEMLHGFGIEHTSNAKNPIPPNPHMQSVMHFSSMRILCHDDIRAIRAVYNLTVKRENAVHDDTCRRDFPMNFIQKLMYLFNKYLIIGFIGFLILSFAIFILTIFYLLLRYFIRKFYGKRKKDKPKLKTIRGNYKPHGYLWHDDII